jgi:hypothetical protein
MTENGSESLPFEPPEQENIRLREENARLRRLLSVHSIPIPHWHQRIHLGYETANRLREHFPELCREIVVKQSQNRATNILRADSERSSRCQEEEAASRRLSRHEYRAVAAR